MLAAYVSGHGFGHATRTAEVLRAIRMRAPELPITVISAAPSGLFAGVVAAPFEFRALVCDVGLVQRDALVIDERQTVGAWRSFMTRWRELVGAEARWLRAAGTRLVLGDIPPLAFATAACAGVHGIALGNFSWDWIYSHLSLRNPALGEAAAWAAEAYGEAALLLRLPFAGELSAFRRVVDLPLVARRPRLAKAEARRRLGLDERLAVLLSFGGAGLPGLRTASFAAPAEYQLLLSGGAAERPEGLPANLRWLGGDALRAAGVGYPELIGAVDVVVTKPGYGIVSDCIGSRTRMVYTDRGDFPEYPIMAAEMPRYLPVEYVTNDAVRSGRIGEAVERVLERPWPAPCELSGAEKAAEIVLGMIDGRGEPRAPRPS